MNDMGVYMFSQYAGKWIPDSPARRRAIISNLSTWRSFSNSSPVEGIEAAIRTFYTRDKKISLYVFGDEFSGDAIQPVIEEIDRINKPSKDGGRQVRIHAVGFPVMLQDKVGRGNTGERFATLMRILCYKNGGTLIRSTNFEILNNLKNRNFLNDLNYSFLHSRFFVLNFGYLKIRICFEFRDSIFEFCGFMRKRDIPSGR